MCANLRKIRPFDKNTLHPELVIQSGAKNLQLPGLEHVSYADFNLKRPGYP